MKTNLPTEINFSHIPSTEIKEFGKQVIALMNIAGVNTGRATHYNTKDEKELAEKKLHLDVFKKDRGVYAAVHCMPGVTDYSKQKAIMALLANSWFKQGNSAISQPVETALIKQLASELPPNRMLNLFCDLRDRRINNTRTKKRVILPALLNNSNLEWWSVKYRKKMRKALEHCWGKKQTSVLKQVLSKSKRTPDESWYIEHSISDFTDDTNNTIECIKFILGCPQNGTGLPLFKAFYDARDDITAGKKLPMEVLEGIRSVYHKDITQEQMLDLTKKNLTSKQKRLVQNKAKKVGVKVEFNPMSETPTELYIYAFKMGMTNDIRKALTIKAKKVASSIPYTFEHIGILVDDSYSMSGHVTQKLRPMAIAYATRDVLCKLGTKYSVQYITGNKSSSHKPSGGTDLATGLVKLAKKGVDTIFIISDGYENQPSGRVSEVLTAFDRIGVNTSIHHINPVIGSEMKSGLRHISNDIPVLPISNPTTIGSSMLIPLLESNTIQGLTGIVQNAVKSLGGN